MFLYSPQVHQLCNNFCKKYISSLEGKMPLDLMLDGDDGKEKPCSASKTSSHIQMSSSNLPTFKEEKPLQSSWDSDCLDNYSTATCSRREGAPKSLPSCAFSANTELGGSPASSETIHDSGDSFTSREDDENERPKQKKRGIFPKMATNIMKAWLFQHLAHPYPAEEQKRLLANDTGLTILQVNNWFINARRRIVQPMIDASSRTGKSPVVTVFKSRKRKISNSDIQHHEPQYQAFPGSYQRATSYQPEYHYPTVPSAYYADTNFTPSHFAAQSQPSCQFAVSVDTSPVALSLPNCMETRPHAMQTPYGHWTANGHPYPAYTSESQNQMYVKAS